MVLLRGLFECSWVVLASCDLRNAMAIEGSSLKPALHAEDSSKCLALGGEISVTSCVDCLLGSCLEAMGHYLTYF